MIYKTKIQNTPNVTTLEFGDGSIEIQGGFIEGSDAKIIMFKNCPPGYIGLAKSKVETVSEFEPEIIMRFLNKESFDTVYDYMTYMKNQYIKDSVNKKTNLNPI